ncbi:MAG: 2-succinyl-5-enolpyruvyl-6-hydroxy-3-cyclohexene-1-carboxylic-acid synthase [Balneolaceae bacterium]
MLSNRPSGKMGDSFSWMSVLMRAFYEEGVRHVFISPGSRSTPATLAAAAHPGLIKHVVLDERSAAFQALGTGKNQGAPALLICTSGTAAANYLPALVEARHSGAPMVVLTADRPPFLRNTGSSQTIDQIKLYGDYAVLFHELGEPVHNPEDLKRLGLLARQSVKGSIHKGGAVHLNAPFRKPLEPDEESIRKQSELNRAQTDEIEKAARTTPALQPRNHLSEKLTETINQSNRPLLIGGPELPYSSLANVFLNLAGKLNSPAICEPGANLPVSGHIVRGAEMFLRSREVRETLKPDLIVRFGDEPVGKAVQTALEEYRDVPMLQCLSQNACHDETISANPRLVLSTDHLELGTIDQKSEEWAQTWEEYSEKSDRLKDNLLQKEDRLTDGHVFSHFLTHLPASWDLMLSNSFPVRDAALFGRPETGHRHTYVNRGAAGIDGIVSTALGIQKSSRRPMLCLTGDLAFLHDANALYSAQNTLQPFVIAVVNNGGGTIFRMLPVYRHKEFYDTYFETPQKVEIRRLAQAGGLDYRLIESKEDLYNQKPDQWKQPRTTVVEIRTNPDASMDLRRELWNSFRGIDESG